LILANLLNIVYQNLKINYSADRAAEYSRRGRDEFVSVELYYPRRRAAGYYYRNKKEPRRYNTS